MTFHFQYALDTFVGCIMFISMGFAMFSAAELPSSPIRHKLRFAVFWVSLFFLSSSIFAGLVM